MQELCRQVSEQQQQEFIVILRFTAGSRFCLLLVPTHLGSSLYSSREMGNVGEGFPTDSSKLQCTSSGARTHQLYMQQELYVELHVQLLYMKLHMKLLLHVQLMGSCTSS
jgi:hypothetical protein